MSTKPKTAIYRRCHFVSNDGKNGNHPKTLQQLIDAQRKRKGPWQRDARDEGERAHYLLISLQDKQGCICGDLVFYDADKKLQLVDTNPDGSSWQGEGEAKDANGKPRKIQERTLFFVVRDNHVAILQSQSLRVPELREFLTWFVGMSDGTRIELLNQPPKATRDLLKDHSINGIKLDGKVGFHAKTIKSTSLLSTMFNSLFRDNAIVSSPQDGDRGARLQMGVFIRTARSSEDEDLKLLENIASALPEDDYEVVTEIHLNDGKTVIKAGELKIAGSITVQTINKNIVATSAMQQLAEWLVEKLETEIIS